ncbi:AAA family ATPase [Sutcliffiella deserti]|uniref:AAA family ATPase n=1 Tax=Sutcliffiella deserti TaxID=2875501 RepID=UPI001CBAEC2B|nr:AAA family ATPase [Sutcliffiella deserti]
MRNTPGLQLIEEHTKKVIVLVTGMSGTGKSTALMKLARRGYRVVDTDYGGWNEELELPNGDGSEWVWNENRIDKLLTEHAEGALFVSGCVSNQGKFYPRFDAVVLLSAPLDVILERVSSRETNTYGKTDSEREQIRQYVSTVEPLLRAGATAEIDTRKPLDEVVAELEFIANTV